MLAPVPHWTTLVHGRGPYVPVALEALPTIASPARAKPSRGGKERVRMPECLEGTGIDGAASGLGGRRLRLG